MTYEKLMKITYNNDSLKDDVQSAATELNAGVERVMSVEEAEVKEQERSEREIKEQGYAAEFSPAPGLVDIGSYVVTFLAGSIAGGVVYDVLKATAIKLISAAREKGTSKPSAHALLQFGDESDGRENMVYFFVPVNMPDEEMNIALDKIPEILAQAEKLAEVAHIFGGARFTWEADQWELSTFEVVSSATQADE